MDQETMILSILRKQKRSLRMSVKFRKLFKKIIENF